MLFFTGISINCPQFKLTIKCAVCDCFMFNLQENLNVVIVDWETGAKHMNYMIAASNTRTVGAYLGRLLTTLAKDLSKVHIVGHSLGAQVAGFAGAWTKGEVNRITGKLHHVKLLIQNCVKIQ